MNKETSDKLLIKVAMKDKSITVLGDIAKMNKKAVYTTQPGFGAISTYAMNETFDNRSKGVSPAEPSPARMVTDAYRLSQDKQLERDDAKPSYVGVLKQRAGDAWDWTKGKWNNLSPETRNTISDVGLGFAGATAGDALVRMLGGRKNKFLRLLGMLGGGALGMAGSQYLRNPDFKNTVNTGFNNLVNKFKG